MGPAPDLLSLNPKLWVWAQQSGSSQALWGSWCTFKFENHCYQPATDFMGEKLRVKRGLARTEGCCRVRKEEHGQSQFRPPRQNAGSLPCWGPSLKPSSPVWYCGQPSPTCPKCSPTSGYFSMDLATHLWSRTLRTHVSVTRVISYYSFCNKLLQLLQKEERRWSIKHLSSQPVIRECGLLCVCRPALPRGACPADGGQRWDGERNSLQVRLVLLWASGEILACLHVCLVGHEEHIAERQWSVPYQNWRFIHGVAPTGNLGSWLKFLLSLTLPPMCHQIFWKSTSNTLVLTIFTTRHLAKPLPSLRCLLQ